MKPKDLATALAAYADALAEADAPRAAARMTAFAAIFAAAPGATVPAAVKALSAAAPGARGSGFTLAEAARVAGPFQRAVAAVARPAARDIAAALALAAAHPHADLAALAEAVRAAPARKAGNSRKPVGAAPFRENVVRDAHQQLEAAVADRDAFAAAMAQLRADTSLTVGEWKELARRFTKYTTRTKADAVKRIGDKHTEIMNFVASTAATGGRSAA